MGRQSRGRHQREAPRLLALVSHDLRSPLAAIQAHADNLIRGVYGEISDEARRRVRQIRRITRECSSLAEAILSGTEPCGDLREAMTAMAAPLRERARARGVRILLRIPKGTAVPGIPSGLLEAAARNLVENAVQASPDGRTVLVRGEREKGWVRVEISDRGPGRADLWMVGPGLGLRLVRGIVDSHGGEVYARPRRGGGSIVGFRLRSR
jgi:signal transduction histidine kinase